MYEISDLEPLVKNGAKLLDELEPRWFHVFTDHKLANFNTADSYNDVLGNVFGSFHTGLKLLFPHDSLYELERAYEKAAYYGLDLDLETVLNYTDDSHPWYDLTSLWYGEIVDRLENGIPNG